MATERERRIPIVTRIDGDRMTVEFVPESELFKPVTSVEDAEAGEVCDSADEDA